MSNKLILKKISIFILLVGIVANCQTTKKAVNNQQKKSTENDLSAMHLNGPVKKIRMDYYRAQKSEGDSTVKGKLIGSRRITFNKDGNKLRNIFYQADGKKNLDYRYQYNKSGKLIDEEKKQVGKSYHEHFTYSYDERGRLKIKQSLIPDTSKTIYFYKEDGQQILQKSYDDEGKLYFKQIQVYKDALLTEEKSYSVLNTDGKNESMLTAHKVYHYDKNGNCIKEQKVKSSGEPGRTTTYTYNDHGNVIQKAYQRGDEDVNVLFKNRYRYSDRQNWIQKIEFAKGTSQTITERKIIYYEGH